MKLIIVLLALIFPLLLAILRLICAAIACSRHTKTSALTDADAQDVMLYVRQCIGSTGQ